MDMYRPVTDVNALLLEMSALTGALTTFAASLTLYNIRERRLSIMPWTPI